MDIITEIRLPPLVPSGIIAGEKENREGPRQTQTGNPHGMGTGFTRELFHDPDTAAVLSLALILFADGGDMMTVLALLYILM